MTDPSTSPGRPATSAPSLPAAVDRATFQAGLDRLRDREKTHTREGDAIAAARRMIRTAAVPHRRRSHASAAVHTFTGPGWERLAGLGALPQCPLWASTGTKNPAYSDVRYVAELIGPGVISTMPEHTLRAFAGHGTVARTLDADPASAQRTIGAAPDAGIDLATLTSELEREGSARSVTLTISCRTASSANSPLLQRNMDQPA
jgi:transaldolase